jgi:transaldolase/glucose-6-phosphate isomerase
LERRVAAGLPLERVASVASFFVSRIDTEVDKRLTARLASTKDAAEREFIQSLMGKAAIANAKLAFRHWQALITKPHWQMLLALGASPQRLLWASTGVKNPAYRDVRYIEELIGADTVNTVPPATLDAFRDHGEARLSLEEGLGEAVAVFERLHGLGISLGEVTNQLLDEGLTLFVQAHDTLLAALAEKN